MFKNLHYQWNFEKKMFINLISLEDLTEAQ